MASLKDAFDLTGKTAIITGGSRGLGLQIADALGEQGARLILAARKAEELAKAQEHLAGKGYEVDFIAADLQKTEEVDRLVKEALAKTGRIDILVNNAGATWGAPTEEHTLDAWDKVMNVNLRAIFYLTQQVGKLAMIPQRAGRIINVASITGLKGNHRDSIPTLAYNTSKGAVMTMTRSLASEWGKYGINVNAIAPGYFPTKMTNGVIKNIGLDRMIADVPLKRLGDDEDLKGAAVLFASAAGKHITGQTLNVDGGVTAV